MTTTYGLVVRFELFPERAAEFDELVRELIPQIEAHEPGTLVYAVHQGPGDPSGRVFYELYADEEAFAEHERQEHTRDFLIHRKPLIESFTVLRGEPSQLVLRTSSPNRRPAL